MFTIVVGLRIPTILTVGRFWAEEGSVFYQTAWDRSWLDALFTVHTGYLNIVASAATLLALHVVPLEQAPRVVAIVAFAIQILPAVLLATSGIAWLEGWLAFAVALILLLIPAGDAEVWLNSITSQFHLALCVGLILASDVRGGTVGALRGAILLLAPLAGPVGGSLAPLFLLRSCLERSRARLIQTALLSVPALIQTVMVFTHPEPARSMGIGLKLLLAVIGIQNVILPMAGAKGSLPIALAAYASFEQNGVSNLMVVTGVLGIGGIGVALYHWGDRAALWLFAAGCMLAVVSYSSALTLGRPLYLLLWLGGRYAYAPTVLFSLSLLGLAATGALTRRAIPAMLIIWMIHEGTGPYFKVTESMAHGANWKADVATWRRDPTFKLRMWPLGWVPELSLDPSARPGN